MAGECAERKLNLAARLLTAAALLLWCGAAAAQELVHFPSSDVNGPGRPATVLDGYLLRPAGDGRHPAVVFLHGCGGLFGGGLFDRMRGLIEPGERDWAGELTRRGYVVLMVDSFRRAIGASSARRATATRGCIASGRGTPMGRCCSCRRSHSSGRIASR